MSNEQAREMVLEILGGDEIDEIHFNFGRYRIRPSLYRDVRAAVEDGRIDVVHEDGADVNSYDSDHDRLIFRWDAAESIPRQAAVVHEATHAGSELRQWRRMTLTDSECVAYLAQCVYAVQVCDDPATDILTDTAAGGEADAIFGLAWQYARQIVERHRRTFDDIMEQVLREAVAGHSWYAEGADDPAGYFMVWGLTDEEEEFQAGRARHVRPPAGAAVRLLPTAPAPELPPEDHGLVRPPEATGPRPTCTRSRPRP